MKLGLLDVGTVGVCSGRIWSAVRCPVRSSLFNDRIRWIGDLLVTADEGVIVLLWMFAVQTNLDLD